MTITLNDPLTPAAAAVEADETDLATMCDAAFPPAELPACDSWMVYIGGSSATHAWTPEELARVAHLPRLPVWVPTPGHENPVHAALSCVARLRELGVPRASENGGRHIRLMADDELGTEPDPKWVNLFCNRIRASGYFNITYGSASWLFGQPVRAGYFVAAPGTPPTMYPHPDCVGKQYEWGETFNRSVIRRSLLAELWQPARAAAAALVPVPPAA